MEGLDILVLVLAVGTCDPERGADETEPGASSPAKEVVRPFEPLWGGCAEIRRTEAAPLCVFEPGEPVRLWIEHPAAEEVELHVDGVRLEPGSIEHYDVPELAGVGLRVTLPETAERLAAGVPGTEPWSLRVRSATRPDPDADVVAELEAMAYTAEVLFMGSAESASNPEQALALSTVVIDRAREKGLTSLALDTALIAAFRLDQAANLPGPARELLDRAHELARDVPQAEAAWVSRSALLHWSRGDLDGAVRGFRAAAQLAMKLEATELSAESVPFYAYMLAELGYVWAAQQWGSCSVPLDSRHRVEVLLTAAWVNLVLRRDGHPHEDPVKCYEAAVELFAPGGSVPDPARLGPALLGLAESHALEHRPFVARWFLKQIGPDTPLSLDDRAFRDDLELRIGLALGVDAGSLEAGLLRLRRSVELAGTPEARWWLAVRQGDVLARARRWEDAVAAYRKAEGWLDVQARYAAIGVGRAAVGASRREGTLRLAGALLELRRPDEALCALREAEGRKARPPTTGSRDAELRAWAAEYTREKEKLEDELIAVESGSTTERHRVEQRVARELDALRDRGDALWRAAGSEQGRPACEDLDPRHDGELLLGLYPAGDHWLVLAQDGEETTDHRVPNARVPADARAREALAEALLGPIAERLGRARRLRVLASGEARQLDVQVLPWHGRPLLQAVTVVHGAELVPVPRPAGSDPPRAVLIADPTRSLPGPELEIAAAKEALEAGGIAVEVIAPEQAWPEAVRRQLEQADLLHFSGHSWDPGAESHGLWPPYLGGTPGEAAHFVLANRQPLSVFELMMPCDRVPRVAVLMGCEAGTLDPMIGGPSLALTFVAKGSREVIASPEALRDVLATELGQQLYATLPGGGRFDAAEALRAAQSALWDEHADPETHLGRYRVWVP